MTQNGDSAAALPDAAPTDGGTSASVDESRMSFVEHLRELRKRLFYCVVLVFVATIGAFALLVVALAGPTWGEKTELLPRRGLDVVFAIDVSTSMRARDVRPDRLERAKAEVGVVLDRLRQHRVGLVAFAGSAFVQCPMTSDVEATRSFLRALSPDIVPQGGTALGEGMLRLHPEANGVFIAILSFELDRETALLAKSFAHATYWRDGDGDPLEPDEGWMFRLFGP